MADQRTVLPAGPFAGHGTAAIAKPPMRPITPQPSPQNWRGDHRVRPARACSPSRGRSPGDAEATPNWLICTRTRADARPRSAAQNRQGDCALLFQAISVSASAATLRSAGTTTGSSSTLRWKADQLPDGTVRWTTPSGRQCVTEPTRYPSEKWIAAPRTLPRLHGTAVERDPILARVRATQR